MNEKEALEITLELAGYIDYVVCGLRGKEFDTKKLNKLQNYIQLQQDKLDKVKDLPTFYINNKSYYEYDDIKQILGDVLNEE